VTIRFLSTRRSDTYYDDDDDDDEDDDDKDEHVDGVGLRLRTATTNRPIVHPPDDICA
jgi:hypothetical protein